VHADWKTNIERSKLACRWSAYNYINSNSKEETMHARDIFG
jgi:hypothetical protein